MAAPCKTKSPQHRLLVRSFHHLSSCPPSSTIEETIEESRRWRHGSSPCQTGGGSFLKSTRLLLAPCCWSPLVSETAGSINAAHPCQAALSLLELLRKHDPGPILLTRRPALRLDRIGSALVSSTRGRFEVIVFGLPHTGYR